MENFAELTWIAIIGGTVASFLVGWVWYLPAVFGKTWAAGSKVELGVASSMPVFAMIAQVVALFLLAMVVGLTAIQEMLFTAIFAILAVATFAAAGGAFSGKSMAAIGIDFGYVFVAGVVMIVFQGIF